MATGRDKRRGRTKGRTADEQSKRKQEPVAASPVPEEPAKEESAEQELEPGAEELEEVELEPMALAPASGTSLARRDPLQSYMAEVTRHAVLSREQEHELAVSYVKSGDPAVAYRLVAANLRLVVKLAYEYHRNPLSLLDLIQEGNIGLMKAVKKYDPYRGVKLSTYAAWWIRAYILRYIMDNWRMVKIGTTEAQRKLFFKLRQEQDRLLAQGIEVTPKLLAERLDVTEQDVVEMDQRLGNDEPMDAPLKDSAGAPRVDRMYPSGAMGAEERLGNAELKALFDEKLAEFSGSLTDKERYIFQNRLIAEAPLTLQEIGDHYGVSRERARQLEAALIDRMRRFMRERIPDFDLVAAPKG